MAFRRRFWKNNPPAATTPITAEELNRMEEGIVGIDKRTPRVGEADSLRVTDNTGEQAMGVTPHGSVMLGNTEVVASNSFRIMDTEGYVALDVDSSGNTRIYSSDNEVYTEPITTLHVFIAAGQSNMSGRGLPVEGPSSPRIMQFGANNRVIEPAPLQLDMVDSPAGTSPALFFAQSYLGSQPRSVGVLLIPAARGATTFQGSPSNPAPSWTWTKGAASTDEFALYERSVQQAQDAIAAAEAQGYSAVLKGVLWHQGEGNGSLGTEGYGTAFDALVANYRDDFEDPQLPVVVGQMCPEGIDISPAKVNVDAAHQGTPKRTERTGFAKARRDGHNPGDTTHFSTRGTSYLGDTYAAGYIQALGNVHPN